MGFGYDVEFIRRRYNRLAAIYPVLEVLFVLPPGIRGRAVQRLQLNPGDAVLEVGCGTGRNFRHLVKAVGPGGRIYGVDYSDNMLARARQLCLENAWSNITLLQQDARELALPETVNAVFFSLSYSVIPARRKTLQRSWSCLRPGGRVVILDSAAPTGMLWRLYRPYVLLLSRATVLGDPDITPGQDLRELTPNVEQEEFQLRTYAIFRGTKSGSS